MKIHVELESSSPFWGKKFHEFLQTTKETIKTQTQTRDQSRNHTEPLSQVANLAATQEPKLQTQATNP